MFEIRNGNVALDVARILSRKPEELLLTDISSKAFKMIQNNRIENVFYIKLMIFLVFVGVCYSEKRPS